MELAQIKMNTVSGLQVAPFNLTEDDIEIESIAHHLATAARWQGATQHPQFEHKILLSVAEHSINVHDYVVDVLKRPDLALQALLHDAPEYLIGDMIRPLKYSHVFYGPFSALEDTVWRVIARKFGMPEALDPLIKVADNAVCVAEWEQVVPHPADAICMPDAPEAAPFTIQMYEPYKAKQLFMAVFREALGLVEADRQRKAEAA